MSSKPTQGDKQIITVAVALTFGLGAFIFPTMTNSFVPSATISTDKSMRGPRYAVFQLWKQPSKYSFAPRLVQPC